MGTHLARPGARPRGLLAAQNRLSRDLVWTRATPRMSVSVSSSIESPTAVPIASRMDKVAFPPSDPGALLRMSAGPARRDNREAS